MNENRQGSIKNPKKSLKNTHRLSENAENSNFEDEFSSVSNSDSQPRTFVSSSNISNSNIYLKNKNLRQHGAYQLSQSIKVLFFTYKVFF